ncbi:hypothetical protein AAFF_G00349120 [Aldrovandia affinis]|uniref:Uncharacterized protein n=1 Tax=Aldrovandia affinis TaxID=143900 RepID=A0AAD7WNH9_9TELE|nr:hypothetical protein AAFF_G00349120 [Aldrovandia affinis]
MSRPFPDTSDGGKLAMGPVVDKMTSQKAVVTGGARRRFRAWAESRTRTPACGLCYRAMSPSRYGTASHTTGLVFREAVTSQDTGGLIIRDVPPGGNPVTGGEEKRAVVTVRTGCAETWLLPSPGALEDDHFVGREERLC